MVITVSIIVAVSMDDVGIIGRNGKLPWEKELPIDMRRFKDLTIDKAVIMGRNTFESIPEKFRPLPKRLNIVLSTTLSEDDRYVVCSDLRTAISSAVKGGYSEIFIIGGERVYVEALESGVVDVIYLTRVLESFGSAEGDACFSLPESGWQLRDDIEYHDSVGKNKYPCQFETWVPENEET